MEPVHPAYRADIDGLRAVAVGLVVLFHFFPNHLRAGFAGVDIFFVISGYLITNIIAGQHDQGRWSYRGFYVRRINRIFPALALLLAANLALGWYALVVDEFQAIGRHVVASATFLSNFALWQEAGYFDNAAEVKPLLHLWSLAIEEQFYVVWPVLIGLLAGARRRMLGVIVLLTLASFLWNLREVSVDPTAAYYSPASRGWQLAVGGLLAYAQRNGFTARLPVVAEVLSALGLALLVATIAFVDKGRGYPGAWALLPTIAAVLLISAGTGSRFNRLVLGWRPLVAIGLISYPLYLWHWSVLVWAKLILMTGNLSVVQRAGLIALSVVLAWLTYATAEKYVRARNNVRSAAVLLAVVVLLGAIGAAFWTGAVRNRMDSDDLARVVAATKDWDYPPASFKPLVRFADYSFHGRRGSGEGTVLFIGDSNLEQYAPRVEWVLDHRPGSPSVIFATKGGCVFAVPAIAANASDCRGKLEAIDELIRSPQVHTVVFVQAWKNAAGMLSDPALLRSFESRLESVSKAKRVFVVQNMPNGAEFSPVSLLSGTRLDKLVYQPSAAAHVDESAAREPLRPLHRLLRVTAERYGATVLDPYDSLCSDGRCAVVDAAGQPVYRDGAHLRAEFVRHSATFLDPVLTPRNAR